MFTEPKPKDSTALQRQKRRIRRLKEQGVARSTVFVHEQCRLALDGLRPALIDPAKAGALNQILTELAEHTRPTNVAQVEQLSPFRYPGGKTWLVPQIRNWLRSAPRTPDVFVEPFAGGAMAGLTAAAEDLAYSVVLSELDKDVAVVWTTIFDGTDDDVAWLTKRIVSFKVSLANVQGVLSSDCKTDRERAFRTLIKNRMQRGGIMAAGAGLVKTGESGKGLSSRWYPETLAHRIDVLRSLKDRITFQNCDAFEMIQQFIDNPNACFFIDPPYTAGTKKAGKRLYTHSEIDHERLFKLMATARGSVMMTYDDDLNVRSMANRHGFRVQAVPMKNTHHAVMHELLIVRP